MSEIKDLSPEAITKRAWERWREMDFSWEGLAQPYILNPGEADEEDIKKIGWDKSLQEYWLTDPKTGKLRSYEELVANGEIIESPGEKPYHIVHLPLYYDLEMSIPTRKRFDSENIDNEISKILSNRISAAKFSDESWKFYSTLHLNGCVFTKFDYFDKIGMEKIAFIADDAVFTEFFSFPDFGHIKIWLSRASFLGSANFSKIKNINYITLDESYFVDRVTFSESSIHNFRCMNSVFCDELSFYDASIDDFDFRNSIVGERTVFSRANISYAGISNINFVGDVRLSFTRSSDAFLFDECKFLENLEIIRANLPILIINNSFFAKDVDFESSEIGRFNFNNISYSDEITTHVKNFTNTIFHEFADFTESKSIEYASFDGTWFERGVAFEKTTEKQAQKHFEQQLQRAYKEKKESRDLMLSQIESGCRALKLAMEKVSDKSREQMFYRFELLARRMQSTTSVAEKIVSYIYKHCSDYGASYGRPVRRLVLLWGVFALAYWPLSDREVSMSWPYGERLIESTDLLSIGHASARLGLVENLTLSPDLPKIVCDRCLVVASVSASRVFPFGAFGEISQNFADNMEKKAPWLGFLYQMLATFESFSALTLAFMFSLAVKRRFQIS